MIYNPVGSKSTWQSERSSENSTACSPAPRSRQNGSFRNLSRPVRDESLDCGPSLEPPAPISVGIPRPSAAQFQRYDGDPSFFWKDCLRSVLLVELLIKPDFSETLSRLVHCGSISWREYRPLTRMTTLVAILAFPHIRLDLELL